MIMHTALRIALVLLCLPLSSSADSKPWVLQRHVNGIQIHQLPTSSGYPITRGTLLMQTAQEKLLNIMRDRSTCTHWVFACRFGTLIKSDTPLARLDYTVIDSPLWFADRDMYLYSTTQINDKTNTVTIRLSSQEHHDSGKAGRVRIKNIYGYWLIQKINTTQLNVTYQIHVNPQLPPSTLLNSYMAESAFHTLNNLRVLAEAAN